MLRKALVAALVAAPVMWAAPASADTTTFINFNPNGGGAGTISIDLLDPSPGNTLSLGAGGAALPRDPITGVPVAGSPVQVLFQANLGVADNSLTAVKDYSNGSNGTFFTFVAGIPTVVDPTSTAATINFDLNPAAGALTAPNTSDFFYMYATTNANDIVGVGGPNDLTGQCFTCGKLILSGVFNSPSAADTNGSFTVNQGVNPPGPALDQHNTNNYPGTTTLVGSGGLNAQITVTFADGNYFPGMTAGSVFKFIEAATQNNVPFKSVDPSACFSLTGIGSCTYPGAGNPNVGPINGEGADVQLESDANFSFIATANVPEPATMTLLGLGLLGVARRRMVKK